MTLKRMAGQCQNRVFGGACIQKAQQQPLALLDPNGLTCAKHVLVYGRVLVAYIGAGGQRMVRRCGAHGFDHGNKRWFPVMNGEKDLLVVCPGVRLAVNHQKSELAAIGAQSKVAAGACVRVIPAGSGRLRCEGIAQLTARRNHRRAFFHCAVVEGVDCQTMPVNDVGIRAGVVYVDGRRDTLAQSNQRSWNLAVVGSSLHNNAGSDLEVTGLNVQRVVRFALGRRCMGGICMMQQRPGCEAGCKRLASMAQKLPSIHRSHRTPSLVFDRPRP